MDSGDLMNIYKCVDRVVRKRTPIFSPDVNFLKNEKEYRMDFIYGKNKNK